MLVVVVSLRGDGTDPKLLLLNAEFAAGATLRSTSVSTMEPVLRAPNGRSSAPAYGVCILEGVEEPLVPLSSSLSSFMLLLLLRR